MKCGSNFYCYPSRPRKFCSKGCFDGFISVEGNKSLRVYKSHSIITKAKMMEAWNKERHREHSRRMQSGGALQIAMQRNGNEKRRGLPRPEMVEWFKNTSSSVLRARAEKISLALSQRFDGRINRGFVRGKQGKLRTRFGIIRYDSGWERDFIKATVQRAEVTRFQRDYVVPYFWMGATHHFLVDFRVEFNNRRPLLVEIKCPYFLGTENTKAKVRAAKLHAARLGMEFRLLASREEAGGGA